MFKKNPLKFTFFEILSAWAKLPNYGVEAENRN